MTTPDTADNHSEAPTNATLQTPEQTPAIDDATLKTRIIELRQNGNSFSKIGSILGISKNVAYHYCRQYAKSLSRDLKIQTSTITREQIQQKIFSLAPCALEKIAKLSASEKIKAEVQLKASADLLDRAGFAPVARSITISAVEEMSTDQLQETILALLSDISPATKDLLIEENSNSDKILIENPSTENKTQSENIIANDLQKEKENVLHCNTPSIMQMDMGIK